MYRGELVITMLRDDDTTEVIQAFMPIPDPENDSVVAEVVIDFVMKNMDEAGDVVSGVATLDIVEAGLTYEFEYTLREDGEWEHQARH